MAAQPLGGGWYVNPNTDKYDNPPAPDPQYVTFFVDFQMDPNFSSCFDQGGGIWVGGGSSGWGWYLQWPVNVRPMFQLQTDEDDRNRENDEECPDCPPDNSSTCTVTESIKVTYNSSRANKPANSMGWGWNLGVYKYLVEDPVTFDIDFYDGSGSFQRWTKQPNGTYQALYRDNYASLAKVNGLVEITLKDLTKLHFRSDGRISTEVDRNGNTTTYSYDGSARLSAISDGEGRINYFDYGSRTDGQPVSIRRQNATTGRQTTLDYHANGRLWKVTNAAGETEEFLYNANNLLEKHLDARGQTVVEYTYDANGRVATEIRYGQLKRTNSYAAGSNDTLVVTVVEEDLTLAPATDPRQTVSTYNRFRRLVKTVDPLGNTWEYIYGDTNSPYLLTDVIDPNGHTTTYDYDAKGNLVATMDAQGNTTTVTYVDGYLPSEIQRPTFVDDNNQPVTYAPTKLFYNSTGNLTRVVEQLNGADVETLYSVRSDGRVQSVTERQLVSNPQGQVTTFEYTTQTASTNAGNLKKITFPAGPNAAPARELNFAYNQYDELTGTTDPAGNPTSYAYDNAGRLQSVTDALSKQVQWNYINGLLDNIVRPANQGSTGTRRTRFVPDAAGRVLQVLQQVGSSTSQEQMRVRYEYDGRSNLKRLARLKRDLSNNVVEKAYTFGFDALNRQTSALDPVGGQFSTAYSAFCKDQKTTSARGVERTVSRDSLCRVTLVATNDEKRELFYDELSRLTKVVQTKGPSVVYEDPLENPVDRPRARFGQSRYAGGAVVDTRKYAYDELDRLKSITFVEDNKTILYEYDLQDRVTKVTDVLGQVTEYSYYNDGRLYKVIVKATPADQVFTYSYDLAGRLYEIQYPAATGVVAKFYDASNNSGWDAVGRLTFLRYVKSGSLLQSFQYAYDDSGNRISMVDTPASGSPVTWSFGYDWLNRLTSATRNGSQTLYAYDESDNRIELQVGGSTQGYFYDFADRITTRKLNGTVAESFSHDADGNMIARTASGLTTNYGWSSSNELVSVKIGVSQISYGYDADGIRKTRGNDTTFYSSRQVSISDLKPTNSTSYVQGLGLLGMLQGGAFYWYIPDALGTVRLVVDSTGAVVASYTPDEFGKQESVSGAADLLGHTFQGALGVRNDWDASGLYYARARYYDSGLGRWLSADPIGFAGGLNAYVGMGNNPTRYSDPSGLDPYPPNFVGPMQMPQRTTITQNSNGSQPQPSLPPLPMVPTTGGLVVGLTKSTSGWERGQKDADGNDYPWKPFPDAMHIDKCPTYVKDKRTFLSWLRQVEQIGKANRYYADPQEATTFADYAEQYNVDAWAHGPHAKPWDITHWHFEPGRRIHLPVQPGHSDPRVPFDMTRGGQ